MGRGLGRFLPAFDRDPKPEGCQLPDEPLRLRVDVPLFEDALSKICLARAP